MRLRNFKSKKWKFQDYERSRGRQSIRWRDAIDRFESNWKKQKQDIDLSQSMGN